MSDETTPIPEPVQQENPPKTDMDKITEMLDARMRPLEEKLTASENENKALREKLVDQDNIIKQQNDDINNYRSNIIMSSGAPNYNKEFDTFTNAMIENFNRGLEIAWHKSGNACRPELKDKWMELAQEEILQYYKPEE